MSWAAILESRLLQAVMAGLFLAVGWIVNGAQNRRAERRRRAERLRDAHRAIFAEIASYLENLSSVKALTEHRDGLIAQMNAEPNFVPLIPREQNDTIFRALVSEIHVLPRVTIDPIVSYYNQLFAIETLIEDMRGNRFSTLETARRVQMYQDYIDLKIQAFHDGHYALRMVSAYADGGTDAALHEEAQIARELGVTDPSSPDVARSGRSLE